MLRLMRDNAGSWIIKILLGIIVIVFIFLGIGPGDTKNENIAVTVNDQVISMDEYRLNYNSLVSMYRNQFGNNFSDDLIKMFGIKEKALDNLINNAIILQEAEKLSIGVSKDELIDDITNIKAFQIDGKFSSATYDNYLKYSRQPADYFEMKRKEDLIVKKVRSLVTDTVKIGEVEAKEWFLWEKATADIDYVLFEPTSYEKIVPTEEDIQAYYEKNKEQYKSAPKIKVAFLSFTPENYKEILTVSDQEIIDYYEANPEKYEAEKTVKARHILIKVDEKADEAIVENARIKAMDVYNKAKEGKETFEALAKKYSEGPSGKNGGDLGTFERGRMVKPFSDTAFSLAAGEISEPVRTQFGWHVIKVEKVNDAEKKKLADVKAEIKNSLLKEKSENLAYDESEDVFTAIVGGAELKDIAETKNLRFVETKFFDKQGGPYEIPANIRKDFADTAFNMALNDISDVVEFKGSYYIVQIKEKRDAAVQTLDLIKDKIVNAATKEMRNDKAQKDAKELLTALKENSKKISDQKNVKNTGALTRNNNDDNIRIDNTAIDAAFKLSETSTLPEEPVKGPKGYYVIQLREKAKPDLSGFEKEKERIENQLLSKKKTNTYDKWLAHLKSQSEIVKNPRLVQ